VIASSFLMQPNLYLLEENSQLFASKFDPGLVAEAVLGIYSDDTAAQQGTTKLLWLLAHFIGLYQSWGDISQRRLLFKALYIQLSSLETEVNIRLPLTVLTEPGKGKDAMDIDESILEPLPAYVASKLTSLVDREGLAWLLRELSM